MHQVLQPNSEKIQAVSSGSSWSITEPLMEGRSLGLSSPRALLTLLTKSYLVSPDTVQVSNLPSGLGNKWSSPVWTGFIWLSPWQCDWSSRTENNRPWHGKAIFEAGV